MANRERRNALRGAEEETLDLLSEVLASEQWAELLKVPLERAARKGKRDLAHKLVAAGAETRQALHEAVLGGHEEILTDLLEAGASIAAWDAGRRTPLHVAALVGNSELVQLLMLRGADKDALDGSESTPLYLAACGGHVDAALALLAGDADVNIQCTSQGNSVLQMAVCQGRVEFLKVAIEHAADLGAVDMYGYTALHVAAIKNNAEGVGVLVDAGANVEARNQFGCTPLHDTTVECFEALMVLLKRGADVNARGIHQQTPLHLAARKAGGPGAAEMVDALLRWGADETILNDDDKTAADVVGVEVEEDDLTENVERVRKLLVNAPADRAWRRRGYLVLCRAHPDRMQLIRESSSRAPTYVARRTRSGAKLARNEASGCNGPMGVGAVSGGRSGDLAGAVARVLGMQEEGLFRAIVGYL